MISKQNLSDKKLTVIFPMAGDGTRFDRGYKPFLNVRDKYFIESAIKPFIKWQHKIKEFIFVFRSDQEENYNITKQLSKIFNDLVYKIIILNKKTSGPVETISTALIKSPLIGPAIFCDSDHSINIDPMFDIIFKDNIYDCILPVWEIDSSEVQSWSIVSVDENMEMIDIAEKSIPIIGKKYYGVIGCYYFQKADQIPNYYNMLKAENFSEIICEYRHENKSIKVCEIYEAEFFGDPVRLHKTLKN
jgi:hypothetical protein|tara:strand:+ start:2223 stop:2960 length:738 start_codon:yes stop_codon:yes gene_type:complete